VLIVDVEIDDHQLTGVCDPGYIQSNPAQ